MNRSLKLPRFSSGIQAIAGCWTRQSHGAGLIGARASSQHRPIHAAGAGPPRRTVISASLESRSLTRSGLRKTWSTSQRAGSFKPGSIAQPVISATYGLGSSARATRNFAAVDIGQEQVGEDEVGRRGLPQGGESRSAGGNGRDREPLDLEHPGQGPAAGGIVVDQQNPRLSATRLRYIHNSSPSPAAGRRGARLMCRQAFLSTRWPTVWRAPASGRACPCGRSPGPRRPGRAARPAPGRAATGPSASPRPGRCPCP